MPIPKHTEISVPALRLLIEREELRLKEFEQPLAKKFQLTEEEVARIYDSGNGKIFYDRISWALSYLSMAGLVHKPKRGVYRISELGIKQLEHAGGVDAFITSQIKTRETPERSKTDTVDVVKSDLTPQEELYESSDKLRQSRHAEIIDLILSKTPREFEHLVVKLLQKMGYGGEVKSSAIVTRYSNDQGIDGIIKEDILGLGKIHIQAKRYGRGKKVSRQEIQNFVGALAGAQSNKGVFITTSLYSSGARAYAENLSGNATVVLIDGEQLAEYVYDSGLGMQVEQVIELKKPDSDFWDAMDDDLSKPESE